jgi:hypothetical protein
VLKKPAIRLAANDVSLNTTARPVTDAGALEHVVEGFRAKYGADDIAQYYSRTDAAVEIPL